MVNAIQPAHYKNGEVDVLEAFRLCSRTEEFRGAVKMNVFKYMMRYQDKGGIEDLLKAREYIDRLIEVEEEEK